MVAADSVSAGSMDALQALLRVCRSQIPTIAPYLSTIEFTSSSGQDAVYFPTPTKSQEAVSAIRGLEGCVAAALADLTTSDPKAEARRVVIDIDKIAVFLMSAYVVTVDGMSKTHPSIKSKIPHDTDLNKAQSILYRRMSASLQKARCGGYYHIHGSLGATQTMQMLGLRPFRDDVTEYDDVVKIYAAAVSRFSVDELEDMNNRHGQAGAPALTQDRFRESRHGRAMLGLPPFLVQSLEHETGLAPLPTPADKALPGRPARLLQGVRVLELCRIIAGPTIGRSLAAYGASVTKVTSSRIPDIPFFQIDVNVGKHCIDLDLNLAGDRAILDGLLLEADVFIDGYRPGALSRKGYGPARLAEIALARKRGIVYVVEDCFGGTGTSGAEWAHRPGWQQIADCVTGVAWAQGGFMGLDEPVVPPFPMSDYGTGVLGCVAALTGLYRRATEGGSWVCRTSLVQYNIFLQSLGLQSKSTCDRLRKTHSPAFFKLRHHDSVDRVGQVALDSVRRAHPHLFDKAAMMQEAWSEGYDANVSWPREALMIDGLRIAYGRATRPNGFDTGKPCGAWAEDEDLVTR